jgi:hypothetical protein
MFAVRFIDPSGLIAISVLFLSMVDVTAAAGIAPLILMAPILIASAPFWLLYQNFWIAMGRRPCRFGSVYFRSAAAHR